MKKKPKCKQKKLKRFTHCQNKKCGKPSKQYHDKHPFCYDCYKEIRGKSIDYFGSRTKV